MSGKNKVPLTTIKLKDERFKYSPDTYLNSNVYVLISILQCWVQKVIWQSKFSLIISTKRMIPNSSGFLFILSLNCFAWIIDFIRFIYFIYSKIFRESFFSSMCYINITIGKRLPNLSNWKQMLDNIVH